MFLKVGRPAWELNIETERLKDKINNDSDTVRVTRSNMKRYWCGILLLEDSDRLYHNHTFL